MVSLIKKGNGKRTLNESIQPVYHIVGLSTLDKIERMMARKPLLNFEELLQKTVDPYGRLRSK